MTTSLHPDTRAAIERAVRDGLAAFRHPTNSEPSKIQTTDTEKEIRP